MHWNRVGISYRWIRGLDCLEGRIGSLRPTAESENSKRAVLAIVDAIIEIGGGAI
jgi:hypothetical protein